MILIFTHPGSRGQKGTGSRIRIRNLTSTRAKELDALYLFYSTRYGTNFGQRLIIMIKERHSELFFATVLAIKRWRTRNIEILASLLK